MVGDGAGAFGSQCQGLQYAARDLAIQGAHSRIGVELL